VFVVLGQFLFIITYIERLKFSKYKKKNENVNGCSCFNGGGIYSKKFDWLFIHNFVTLLQSNWFVH